MLQKLAQCLRELIWRYDTTFIRYHPSVVNMAKVQFSKQILMLFCSVLLETKIHLAVD